MKFINGITILLVYQLIGEISVRYMQLPIPGPVLGMILLFLSLMFTQKVNTSLDTATTTLLSHFSLLFVPAGVGIMVHFERIENEWLPISVALLLSTLLTLICTAAIMWLVNCVFSKSGEGNA